MNPLKWLGLALGLLGLLAPMFMDIEGLTYPGQIALGIFFFAALFWIFEPIPIWATSLMVIFLQVLLISDSGPLNSVTKLGQEVEEKGFLIDEGSLTEDNKVLLLTNVGYAFGKVIVNRHDDKVYIQAEGFKPGMKIAKVPSEWKEGYKPKNKSVFYGTLAHGIIILFLGGFFLAAAAVKYNLDKNLTRAMLGVFGTKPANVVLGLLLVTAVLSAFMSNTATTAMMMTVVLPIIAGLGSADRLKAAVALAIPCGANIGGLATPIGTPPNAVVLGQLAKQGVNISFGSWMVLAVPLVIIMLFFSWRALMFLFPPSTKELKLKFEGGWDMSTKAKLCYLVFGATVLLWVTDKLHGVSSSVVAFLPIAAMPALGIINKNDIKGFSWDVLWLMAGGISLGITMKMGPAEWLIDLVDWTSMGPVVVILALGLVAYILSNLISNTVAATILIPIAISMGTSGAVGESYDLVLTSIVIGVMVSFSMLLPVSTPPNAIAMATNMISTKDLQKVGIVVGIGGFIGTSLFAFTMWPFILG